MPYQSLLFYSCFSLDSQFVFQQRCSEPAPFPPAATTTKVAPEELLVTAGFSVVLSVVVLAQS